MIRGNVFARRQRQKRIKKAVFAAIIIIILAAYLLIKALGEPAKGAVAKSPDSNPAVTAAPRSTTEIPVVGKHIKFSYLDSYRSLPTSAVVPPQLEIFDFITKKSPFSEIALNVGQLTSQNLSDDGSYNMRARAPDKYKLEQWTVNGQTIPVFAALDGEYSKAAFIKHNGMLLTVTLTGQGDETQMRADQMKMLNSLGWR
jgi:hypothetical protein